MNYFVRVIDALHKGKIKVLTYLIQVLVLELIMFPMQLANKLQVIKLAVDWHYIPPSCSTFLDR